MASIGRPQSIAFAALVLASALVWLGRGGGALASTGAVAAAARVPTTLGGWTGSEVPVEQKVFDILETQDVTILQYQRADGESPVWFSQVAGFGNRAAFHPPELCYVGSHFEVLERGPIMVTAGGAPRQVMRLIIAQDKRKFEAWYWFTAGRKITANYYRQQWWLVLDQLRGKPSDGTLVRISTITDGSGTSKQQLQEFLNELLKAGTNG